VQGHGQRLGESDRGMRRIARGRAARAPPAAPRDPWLPKVGTGRNPPRAPPYPFADKDRSPAGRACPCRRRCSDQDKASTATAIRLQPSSRTPSEVAIDRRK
jgi:hypothetical protein